MQAGSVYELTFRVEPGVDGLPAGAGLLVTLPGTWETPQVDWPDRAGWVRAAVVEPGREDTEVSMGLSLQDEDPADGVASWHTGVEGWSLDAVLPEVAAGQAVEIRYGDTSEGGPGARASFLARDAWTFPLGLDENGDGTLESTSEFVVATTAGGPRGAGYAPGGRRRLLGRLAPDLALDQEEVTQGAEGEPGLDGVVAERPEKVGPLVRPAAAALQALEAHDLVELGASVGQQQPAPASGHSYS